MDASNVRQDRPARLIYKGFGAQEIYQSLVEMRGNDNCVWQSGLGQASWYVRAKNQED